MPATTPKEREREREGGKYANVQNNCKLIMHNKPSLSLTHKSHERPPQLPLNCCYNCSAPPRPQIHLPQHPPVSRPCHLAIVFSLPLHQQQQHRRIAGCGSSTGEERQEAGSQPSPDKSTMRRGRVWQNVDRKLIYNVNCKIENYVVITQF